MRDACSLAGGQAQGGCAAQVPKPQRRTESRHVAVVQLEEAAEAGRPSALRYLLVKRPATGLLAGRPPCMARGTLV